MSATPDIDLIWLQKRADLCGCYVNRHSSADVTRGGDLYLQTRRTQRNFGNVPTLINRDGRGNRRRLDGNRGREVRATSRIISPVLLCGGHRRRTEGERHRGGLWRTARPH